MYVKDVESPPLMEGAVETIGAKTKLIGPSLFSDMNSFF